MNNKLKRIILWTSSSVLVIGLFLAIWIPISMNTSTPNQEESIDDLDRVLDFTPPFTKPDLETVMTIEPFASMVPQNISEDFRFVDSYYAIYDPSFPEYASANLDGRSEYMHLTFDGSKLNKEDNIVLDLNKTGMLKAKIGINLNFYMSTPFNADKHKDAYNIDEITEEFIKDKFVSDGTYCKFKLEIKNGDSLIEIIYNGKEGIGFDYKELFEMITSAKMFEGINNL